METVMWTQVKGGVGGGSIKNAQKREYKSSMADILGQRARKGATHKKKLHVKLDISW